MKVHILVALLLRAQGALGDPPRALTGREQAWAAAMIERSDNDAANALWEAAGGEAGMRTACHRLGLTRTEPHPAGRWGLSTTTATDQLRLLRAVYEPGPGGGLTPSARARVRELMRRVVPAQRWGVTAAAPAGAASATAVPEVKNGWLPRTATGLWVINSVGRVTVDGRAWLLAVLSDGHATREAGVAAVEDAARAAVRALTRREGPREGSRREDRGAARDRRRAGRPPDPAAGAGGAG
ncbi:serine hydrolase [Streptomyces albus subsp. chlorinus]|nr:serine hydrolase [Streptomyces albus subsp. chlorinus]